MKKFRKLKKYLKNIFEITILALGAITVIINALCIIICLLPIILLFLIVIFFVFISVHIYLPLFESVAFYFFDIRCSIVETLRNARFKKIYPQEWMSLDEICLSVSERMMCKENNSFKIFVLRISCKIILDDLVKELIVIEDVIPKSVSRPHIKILAYKLQNDNYTPRRRRFIKKPTKKGVIDEILAPV